MWKMGKEEAFIAFGIVLLLVISASLGYATGWDKGYIASLVDAKKGLPPKWVITQRDDGTSGWDRNVTKEIK